MSYPSNVLYLVETVEPNPKYLASFSTNIEAVSFADGFAAGGGKTINVRQVKPGSGVFLYTPHSEPGLKAEVPTDGG